VAGILPVGKSGAGTRLSKIAKTIEPRLRTLQGLPDGIQPAKVDLIFNETIEEAIASVRKVARTIFDSL
jgi:hypothetical protein